MKKELVIYFGILIFLALGMHYKEWLSHPVEHTMNLSHSGAYGFGAIHPLIFAFVLYLIVGLFRFIIKLVSRKKNDDK